jgi:hypothetical protein
VRGTRARSPRTGPWNTTARTGTARTSTAWSSTARSRPGGSVAARWHRAWLAPAVRVVILDGRARAMVPAGGATRCARSRRPVQAIGPRRNPPSVRQPVPARSRGPAVDGWPSVRHGPAVRGGTLRGSAPRGSAVRGSPMGSGTGGHAIPRAAGIRAARVRPDRMLGAHRRCAHRRRAHGWRGRVRPARARRSAMRERPVRSASVRERPVRSASVRERPVRCASIRERAVRPAAVRVSAARATRARRPAPGYSAAGHPGVARVAVRWRTWRETTRRPSRLARPRLPGRHLARAPQQVPVLVLGLGPATRPGRIVLLGRVPVAGGVGPEAVAAAVPLVPGRTVRVTAEAGLATFHPIPPGPLCPAGAAGHFALTS